MVDRHFQEIFATPKTMAVLKNRRWGFVAPFVRCVKLFIAGHILLRSIDEPGQAKELELWRLQLFSHVRPNPTEMTKGEVRPREEIVKKKVMGRSSPGGSGGNMSSFSLQYQVAYSSQSSKESRKEETAPQIAGCSHLWKKGCTTGRLLKTAS